MKDEGTDGRKSSGEDKERKRRRGKKRKEEIGGGGRVGREPKERDNIEQLQTELKTSLATIAILLHITLPSLMCILLTCCRVLCL